MSLPSRQRDTGAVRFASKSAPPPKERARIGPPRNLHLKLGSRAITAPALLRRRRQLISLRVLARRAMRQLQRPASVEEVEIVFIEVKTGRSVLSARERAVKKAVEDKKVSWRVFNPDVEVDPTALTISSL